MFVVITALQIVCYLCFIYMFYRLERVIGRLDCLWQRLIRLSLIMLYAWGATVVLLQLPERGELYLATVLWSIEIVTFSMLTSLVIHIIKDTKASGYSFKRWCKQDFRNQQV
ncbi:hypothetical protein AVL55_11165 [Alteromonas macleodii]|uniref:Uncharacterized protein n=1 Tax=Alteromonas macleodii TaxID=28108 RepID=A0A126Q2L9_ALTMA|nr:hypothetical protein AVL55_11165 [Alteromonas macleodii]